MIYLDYAASCVPFPEAVAEAGRVAGEVFGNPGALHRAGCDARRVLQESRLLLARLTNVRPEEIFFTSGGTESNNWAIEAGCAGSGKRHILCSAAEHSSVLEPVRRMEKKGYTVTYLPPDRQGIHTPEAVEAALRPDTVLLCIHGVNNETGVVQDVQALARVARSHRVRYFCDGVQSFGHVGQALDRADLVSLSAHKLGGPRGVGCLILRQPLVPKPMLLGGGQEFGARSGTENLPGIAGFALAAQLSLQELEQEQRRLTELRQLLERELLRSCPGLEIAGAGAPRSSILSCRFPGLSAEEAVMRLDLAGVCASPGAACAARAGEPSHVLRAMGYSPEEAAQFVRFSLGRNTTREEILETAAITARIYQERRCPL